MSHANARLTVHGRMLVVRRVRLEGRPKAHVAKELGVSRQCVHRWVARFDAEGWDRLQERSSRPHTSPTRTSPEREAEVLTARREHRCGPAGLAVLTGVPERTVTRVLRRHLVAHLSACDPLTGAVIRSSKSTAVRYERDAPGDLIHMDVKKLGRIPDGGGWKAHGRATGSTSARKRAKVGFDYVHSAVDDHSRLAYTEVLLDEKRPHLRRVPHPRRSLVRERRHHQDRTSHDRQPLVLRQVHRPRAGWPAVARALTRTGPARTPWRCTATRVPTQSAASRVDGGAAACTSGLRLAL